MKIKIVMEEEESTKKHQNDFSTLEEKLSSEIQNLTA